MANEGEHCSYMGTICSSNCEYAYNCGHGSDSYGCVRPETKAEKCIHEIASIRHRLKDCLNDLDNALTRLYSLSSTKSKE